MSEDPKLFDAGDYNLFRYCHNDPIDFTDPMGTQDERQDPWYTHAQQAQAIDITIAEKISMWQKSMETSVGGEQAFQALQGLNLDYHPVNLSISMGRDPRQNWNRDIHATAFSGGNDPTDNTNPAFLNQKLGRNELGSALPGGEELRGRSIDVVYTRTGARQNAIPVVDKGPFFDGTLRRPADRYWNTGARPLAESIRANRSGLDLSPQVWRNFGFGVRYDRYGVPYPTGQHDPDPLFDWRFH